MEKLPDNLDQAIRIIRNNEPLTLSAADIRQLLLMRLISEKQGGGWLVNGNGREYLRWHKN